MRVISPDTGRAAVIGDGELFLQDENSSTRADLYVSSHGNFNNVAFFEFGLDGAYADTVAMDPANDNSLPQPFLFSTTYSNVVSGANPLFAVANAHTNVFVISGDGSVTLNNVVVNGSFAFPTNGVTSASSVDFNVPEATTNISGAVSFTALLNFNSATYNWAIRHIVNNSGSDRTITVGAWATDGGRTSATTYTSTNATCLDLLFEMQLGQFTNVASKVHYK